MFVRISVSNPNTRVFTYAHDDKGVRIANFLERLGMKTEVTLEGWEDGKA
jgi:hypothetical protein